MSGPEVSSSTNKRPREQQQHTSAPTISLKVKGQDGVDVFFNIKRNAKLKKVLMAYCEKQNYEYKTIVFLYNGERILERQSPDDLNMAEEDEIDALRHQTGGGRNEK
ncbi:hypothetical protein Vadar_012631 [Vaccinium darrowii]|uniref:Uncharacterized protein n=1 Tax=Vaccinium darrowii TaxID=229202 RepID=A0ACB7X0B3_9ERIC|nr:hypothetical protein Vadar_012631 [Vaccinium darrowii]